MHQTKDQIQFQKLLHESRRIVYGVIGGYCRDEQLKDDLYQEVCARAWSAYNVFREESKFSTWIAAIARNTTISWLRATKKSKILLCGNVFWDIPDTNYTEESIGLSPSVIEKFSAAEKETLQMRIDGLSFTDISAIRGEPENRVRVRMHRLKKLLEEGVRNKYRPKKRKIEAS